MFLLYSYLQTNVQPNEGEFRGLGYVDSRKDVLTVELKFQVPGQPSDHGSDSSSLKRHRKSKKAQKTNHISDKTVDIQLAQDKTALRSRKGDTGSVLWKARFERGPNI